MIPKDYYVLKAESNYDRMKRNRKRLKLVVDTIVCIMLITFAVASAYVMVTTR